MKGGKAALEGRCAPPRPSPPPARFAALESPRRRSRPASGQLSWGVALGLWAGVVGLGIGLSPLSDNSFLTHLAAGRLILDDGGIPRVDPFSFTAAGEPWVMQSWLAAGCYAALDRLFGGHGLLLSQAGLTALLALLAVRLTRSCPSLLPRAFIVACALGVGSGSWAERPLTIGLVCLSLALLAAKGRVHPRWLLLAFPLWVNVHGSFPLGLVALACVAAGAALDGGARSRKALVRLPPVQALGFAVVGTLLGAAGPLGPRLLTFPLELLGRGEVLSHVVEWQAPQFTDGWQRLWILQLVVAAGLVVRRPSWRAGLPLAVFGAASLLAARNMPVASLVALPGMAHGFAGVGSLSLRHRSPVAASAACLAVLSVPLLVATAVQRPAYDLSIYPARQLAVLGDPGRLATHDFAGNWLEATLGPRRAAFFDDRFDMYPPAVATDYWVLHQGKPEWGRVLDRYGIDTVVWRRDKPLAALVTASPEWQVVAADRLWVAARRR